MTECHTCAHTCTQGEACPGVNIPHTVIYQDSTPIAWYFTSGKDDKVRVYITCTTVCVHLSQLCARHKQSFGASISVLWQPCHLGCLTCIIIFAQIYKKKCSNVNGPTIYEAMTKEKVRKASPVSGKVAKRGAMSKVCKRLLRGSDCDPACDGLPFPALCAHPQHCPISFPRICFELWLTF